MSNQSVISDPACHRQPLTRQYGEVIWPKYETTHKPPKTSSELQKEMERLRMERQARRERADSTQHAAPLSAPVFRTTQVEQERLV
jgi:hypothetical protein